MSTLQRRIFSTISMLRMPKEMVNILLGLYKNLKRVSVTFLVQVGMKYEIPAGFYQSSYVNKIIQIQGVQFDILRSKWLEYFQKKIPFSISLHAILCFCQFLNLSHLNNSLVFKFTCKHFSCFISKREFWNIHFRTTKVINNNKSHFYCPFSCVPTTNAKLKKIIGKPQNGHRL